MRRIFFKLFDQFHDGHGGTPFFYFFPFFTVCFTFMTARFSSRVVSLPVVSRAPSRISPKTSAAFSIMVFRSALSAVGSFDMLLERSLILAYVSMISKVVWIALGLLIIVASIQRPFSVKAFRSALECLILLNRWKFSTSSFFFSAVSFII